MLGEGTGSALPHRRRGSVISSLSTRPCNGSARHYCCWTPWSDFILSTKTALQTSLLCSVFLRAINRRHQLALVLVHHMAKRSRRNLGQSLRGSSDLHAWTDSACYLVRRPDDRLQLTVEHRSAPAPDPLLLRLSGGGDQPLSLLVDSADAPPPPLAEAVRAALRSARQPLTRTVLRQRLRVNNARLGVALQTLQQRGLAVRSSNGWYLPA